MHRRQNDDDGRPPQHLSSGGCEIHVHWEGDRIELDPVGFVDCAAARTLIEVAECVDAAVGTDGCIVRLAGSTGISTEAWSALRAAGARCCQLGERDLLLPSPPMR